MESLGQYLRQEREQKGISLEEVHRRTKVSLNVLRAMEGEGDEPLPPPVILRGFVMAYARAVGLDPQQALEIYSGSELARPKPLTPRSGPEPKRVNLAVIGAVAAAVVLGLALLLLPRGNQPPAPLLQTPAPAPVPVPENLAGEPEAGQPQAPEAIPERARKEQAAVHAGASLSTTPAAAPRPLAQAPAAADDEEGSHLLRVRATERTWMRVSRDGGPAKEYLFRPGNQLSLRAERFQLTVGNAGGLELSFNGQPLGSLGASGEVVSLTLPKAAPQAH